MDYAPVAMFVYNRDDHFNQTYSALSKCPEAKDTVLYVFSDGAKNENAKEAVERVRASVRNVSADGDFKEVNLIESATNQGLAKSIINGVTKVLSEYGKIIVIEDDCVASPFLLKFLNRGLDYYCDDKSVGALAGYTPQIEFPDNYVSDVFAAYRSCSCCWATWNDRWIGVDWELSHFKEFVTTSENVKRMNSNGKDRLIRLYRQTKGNGSSWSVRFGAHLIKNNMMTVYPRYSYISNIGCDETGVHSKAEDAEKMRVDLSKAIENPKFEKVTINREVQKVFKKHYSGGLISDIKRFLLTKYIVFKEKMK